MVAAQFANQIQNLEDRMLAKAETLRRRARSSGGSPPRWQSTEEP